MALESKIFIPCRKFPSRWVLFSEGDEFEMSILEDTSATFNSCFFEVESVAMQADGANQDCFVLLLKPDLTELLMFQPSPASAVLFPRRQNPQIMSRTE